MHNDGKASKYTRSRRPVKLIAQWPFKNKSEAMKHEIKFKALPRKEKIKSIGNKAMQRFSVLGKFAVSAKFAEKLGHSEIADTYRMLASLPKV